MAQVDDIDVLAEKLEAFLKNQPNSASSESLARLSEAARKVSLATESTGDTIHRVISLVLLPKSCFWVYPYPR